MKFKNSDLTDEQEIAINCVGTGENTKIQAPAGSGKTFTLEAAADFIKPKRGAYLAFNKAIADNASHKFPPTVECRTGHSFAFRAVGNKYSHRLGKLTGKMIAEKIDIGPFAPFKTATKKGYLLLDTIKNYCYSADEEISFYNAPQIIGPFTKQEQFELKKDLAQYAKVLWEKMIDLNDSIPITHDTYLKLWQLSNPKIPKDFILFDESQDANAVMLDIVQKQKHSQKIYVGDRHQQIYAWRGAVNAMDMIKTKHAAFLTQSFRFGEPVAKLASDILINYTIGTPPPRIKGFPEKTSIVTLEPIEDPNVIICRTNQGVVSNVFSLLEQRKRVYIQGGAQNIISLIMAIRDLQGGRSTFHPGLFLFSNYMELLEYISSESGGDLKPLLKLIDQYGFAKLITALQSTCSNAEEADIILTTAHKAKGLEFSKVKLWNDFLGVDDDEDTEGKIKILDQGEINLLYVAATRALDILDISSCSPCHEKSLQKGRENVLRYKRQLADAEIEDFYDEEEEAAELQQEVEEKVRPAEMIQIKPIRKRIIKRLQ